MLDKREVVVSLAWAMGRTRLPLTLWPSSRPSPPSLRRFGSDSEANAALWIVFGVMWLLALVAVLLQRYADVRLGFLGFLAWVVLLGGIALLFLALFRGR